MNKLNANETEVAQTKSTSKMVICIWKVKSLLAQSVKHSAAGIILANAHVHCAACCGFFYLTLT